MSNQAQSPFIRTLKRLRAAFWRRRFFRGTIRAMWLALLVPVVVMGGYLWFGWQVSLYEWISVAVLIGIVTLIWSMRPISLKKMTYRLDSLLGTRAQLVTALEVSQSSGVSTSNPVSDRLLQNAVNISINLRQRVRLFHRGFWIEANALIAVAAILGAMFILDALSTNIPNATPIDMPPAGQEPGADDVLPPDAQLFPPPFQQPPQPITQQQLQSALDSLAEALRDQAVTRAAADALDAGDVPGAAEELRRVADQLDGLSEEARQELGESLQEAADEIGDSVPNLTEILEEGSDALGNEDVPGSSEALEALADELDAIDGAMQENEGQPQPGSDEPGGAAEGEEESETEETEGEAGAGDGSGEGDGQEGLGEEAEERLPIDGEPLELESDPELEDRVLQPSELDAETGEDRTTDSPFARQPLNAAGDDLGADPLSYPWEKRDIVREYFTPQQ